MVYFADDRADANKVIIFYPPCGVVYPVQTLDNSCPIQMAGQDADGLIAFSCW